MIVDRRKQLIKLIHIARNQLAMPDDSYRALLLRVSGGKASSCADLGVMDLSKILAELESKGFKVKGHRGTRPLANDGQSKLVRHLWLDLHAKGAVRDPSERALGAYARRQTGIAALQWLSTEQASKLIEQLKQWRCRIDETEGP